MYVCNQYYVTERNNITKKSRRRYMYHYSTEGLTEDVTTIMLEYTYEGVLINP